eukprot:CAMPEP_0178415910 /NCGR_PEP_ID=MMETSP0689_2-20121128/23792_1 /TAXON_ID=160604 /ORGANISM="Amphidinium massartii, Strain CS-259" /LENGTH=195 /DNA_ID=CAMNT_0020037239 /DNA_START=26 /DNA_END=613 /DNA_ORIENTATION=+
MKILSGPLSGSNSQTIKVLSVQQHALLSGHVTFQYELRLQLPSPALECGLRVRRQRAEGGVDSLKQSDVVRIHGVHAGSTFEAILLNSGAGPAGAFSFNDTVLSVDGVQDADTILEKLRTSSLLVMVLQWQQSQAACDGREAVSPVSTGVVAASPNQRNTSTKGEEQQVLSALDCSSEQNHLITSAVLRPQLLSL